MEERIFLYGTLRPGHAPWEIADAVSRLRRIAAGTVRGRLYDLGSYPGVVLDDAAAEVRGEVFSVPDEETLRRMDAYEGYLPDDAAASLFARVKTLATLEGGAQQSCWVYVYNGLLPPP
ncbi:MAG: gamma-glutamylcyclotransferase family protein [Acidobacteriaceae bacterium]|jgi:gamma-glutamylcyclotransferase (GGCT)/AIG2-like uncharacterized protein YtfP